MGLDGGPAPSRASRSTWSSSARAPTRASATCAPRRRAVKGRKVAPNVRVLVVPGSQESSARRRPRASTRCSEAAGAEWRESGCSMCIAMNGDQLRARAVRREHQQPQLRGAAGAGRAHAPRVAAHGRRGGRHAAASPTRARCYDGIAQRERMHEDRSEGAVHHAHVDVRGAARRRRRHRPDHPGALPQGHRQEGPRRQRLLPTGASSPTASLERRFPAQPAGRGGRAGARRRATTSAAARRASTRPGRSWAGACAPSSRSRSPTSSRATR